MAAQVSRAVEERTANYNAFVETEGESAEAALDNNELRRSGLPGIIGNSPALLRALDMVRIVAPTDATVLINGETGTGKELIAEAIHKYSHRSAGPFVKVNCAAIPAGLLESELFGHERGAFTGAIARRVGRFELANHGTILLDEIGELPPELQPKLLRVLQEREFERIGGTKSVRVNVRVIAATNRDLKCAISGGTFRLDLFYRLNVFPIDVPALRERGDDFLLLLDYFVKRHADKLGTYIRSIDPKTLKLFQAYHWPGNIRELQNVVERSVILSSGDVLSVDEDWLSDRAAPIGVPG